MCPPVDLPLNPAIVCSQANCKHYGEFLKRARMITMPMWDINEIYRLNDSLLEIEGKLDKDILAERYKTIGGVPRIIFERTMEYLRYERWAAQDC